MSAIPEDFPRWRLRCGCERCGHAWLSRWHPKGDFITVRICPRCKSRRWNDPPAWTAPAKAGFECSKCGRITHAPDDVDSLECPGCGYMILSPNGY